jgi:hypothetical protein
VKSPAGLTAIFTFQLIEGLSPNPRGRSLMTEHTDPCKIYYYLWVIQGM